MMEKADFLTLIGCLELPTHLAQFTDYMAGRGWQVKEGPLLVHEYVELDLEGESFVLLHGRLAALEHLPILIEALRGAGAHWQIDVFEEDGRLVKKLQA